MQRDDRDEGPDGPAHESVATGRRGAGFVEALLLAVLFLVVFVSTLAIVESGRRPTRPLEIARAEGLAQHMVLRLEEELAGAVGASPAATLAAPLAERDTTLSVTRAAGFPPAGVLVLAGPAGLERLSYGRLSAGPDGTRTFGALERGVQCTAPLAHPAGTAVCWTGLAEPLRTVAAETRPDGTALAAGFPTAFRGNGTGFAYQRPLGAAQGAGVTLGALVHGRPCPGGWSAVEFRPRSVFDEADAGADVNGDGDRVDLFDVGSLWRISWDAADPGQREEVELGPPAILQEQCGWGGDLDGDGFDDPIFLWNPESQVLRLRLFLVGRSVEGGAIVRDVSATLLLRTEPDLE